MKHALLKSKRLLYRKFTNDDFEQLRTLLSNERVCLYLPGPPSFNDEQIKRWLLMFQKNFSDEIPSFVYALTERDTGAFIGYAGCFYVPEYKQNEIMYAIVEEHWHKGYATEAAFKMLTLSKRLHLAKVIAFTHINNIASEKVIQKLGYNYIETIDLWGERLKYYELDL